MKDPHCSCSAGSNYIHVAGCAWMGRFGQPKADEAAEPEIIVIGAARKKRKHRRLRKPPAIPSYRFTLQFNFTRPVNVALWKTIKAPKGWKKNPTTAAKQETYRGVRFRCDDFKYALAPADIELLHMKLLLSLKST